MKRLSCLFIFSILMVLSKPVVCAQSVFPQYQKSDSIKVVHLLETARKAHKNNYMVYFARQLKGVPYVAQTLEVNKTEKLIVNLRQLDCTTYVENVCALTLCMKQGKYSFDAFCRNLQALRYKDGILDGYTSRLHYFTQWIENNTQMGFVKETQMEKAPFNATQVININYMSTNTEKYPMLKGKDSLIAIISSQEKEVNGRVYRYITKAGIYNNQATRNAIHDGDIIAILTSKKGLDTSHIGIAIWHKNGLHLLNASQIHKKVVEEPMTLRQYMMKHPSQTGIRVIKVL